MAITSGYFNSVNGDRKYNADQMSEYFEGIINEGVCQHIGGGLAVTAGTGLTVSVATGKAFIGQKWIKNDAALTLTITTAADQARIDAVVLRRNTTNRVCEIAVKTGTPSASPSAPAMTRTSTTYEMALAYVNVAAGATSVTVTDKRADSSVCGWATVAQSTSGEVDAMLNDMKTGFDGVVYPSPAAMVQGCDNVLQGEIDDANEDLSTVYADYFKEMTVSLDIHGLIKHADGTMLSTDNGRCTPLYRTTGFDKIRFLSAYMPTTYDTVSYYDSTKTYMQSVSHEGTGSTVNIEESIPTGAKYVAFGRYGTGSYSAKLIKTAETVLDQRLSELDARKCDKYYEANLNKDPLYSNVTTTGTLSLTGWTFDNSSTSYSVTDGKLTYTPVNRSDRLMKAVGNMIGGHKYYVYLPIESTSQDAFITIGGSYAQTKGKNTYIEAIISVVSNINNSWIGVQGAASYSYTLGELVVIDLTANNIPDSDAAFVRAFFIRNPYGNLQDFIVKEATFNNGIVNVRDFGAKGDGSTDDTLAIADAISNVGTGGILYFPAGTYVVTNIALKSNMTVRGEGSKLSIIALRDGVPTYNYDCLNVVSISNVLIEKVGLFGNKDNNETTTNNADGGFNGIHMLHSDHIIVNEIEAYSNGYHGIIMVDSHDVEIRNSKFYDNGYRPIHGHDNVSNVKILNCECYENGQGFTGETGGGSSVGNGFDAIFFFGNVDNLEIANCYIHDPHTLACIQIGGALNDGSQASKNFLIHDNVLDTGETGNLSGVHVMGKGISNVKIENNIITAFYGIRLAGDGENHTISILGNTIIPLLYGIYCQSEYEDIVIDSTTIENDKEAPSAYGMSISDSNRIIINACNVSDFIRGIDIIGCDDVIISSCCSGNARLSQCLSSMNADSTSSNVKMVYNLTNSNVTNSSDGGIIV